MLQLFQKSGIRTGDRVTFFYGAIASLEIVKAKLGVGIISQRLQLTIAYALNAAIYTQRLVELKVSFFPKITNIEHTEQFLELLIVNPQI